MRTTIPIEVEVPSIIMNLTLPQDTPLMCDGETASKLFGLSQRTLTRLARQYPDFPVRRIGSCVRFLVPDMYAWFRDWQDGIIEVD